MEALLSKVQMTKETNAAKLFTLFGGVTALSNAAAIDKATISRWDSSGPRGNHGRVPPQYNATILEATRGATKRLNKNATDELLAAVNACLDPNVCPCCHRPLPVDGKLDRRAVKRAR